MSRKEIIGDDIYSMSDLELREIISLIIDSLPYKIVKVIDLEDSYYDIEKKSWK